MSIQNAKSIPRKTGLLLAPNDPRSLQKTRFRMLKDRIIGYGVTAGGAGVIVAILLIFFFLLYVVFPLFEPATMLKYEEYTLNNPEKSQALFLGIDEQSEVATLVNKEGGVDFFEAKTGKPLAHEKIILPEGHKITSFGQGDLTKEWLVFGLDNGSVVVAQTAYEVSYPNNVRLISPTIHYPLGKEAMVVDEEGKELARVTVQTYGERTRVAALTGDGRLLSLTLSQEESLLTGESTLKREALLLDKGVKDHPQLLMGNDPSFLWCANDQGELKIYDLGDPDNPTLRDRLKIVPEGSTLTSLTFLTGGISLLVGDSQGTIGQWFFVRDKKGKGTLEKIREFSHSQTAITHILPEPRRKGFIAIDAQGKVGIYHATAHRTLAHHVMGQAIPLAALSPRAETLLTTNAQGQFQFWHIRNEHPEVSWSSLWGKVWYESYDTPQYIWQSSAATNDFEPKFSMVPLVLGTIKASFYAMLVAIPLAIMGAVYTAYFMSARMRALVKPTIEIMEALPTVILGFLAGLWLAPMIEQHLIGIFSLVLLVPLSVLLASYLWYKLPAKSKSILPDNSESILLIPVILLSGYLAMALSQPLETLFFHGDIRYWLTHDLGITFDQRNALIVGIAMGFAVIPTIFTITEDAIFGVPKHLTHGSLALGATPWQTLLKVVLLTASPGIFSAIMMGLGRAVGETMIVLMATGNTPVLDFSIFQGMRTLSANIAVEMPEAEVDSTHFRILFLSGLILFMLTFFFNTAAEIVRTRLRKKYSSL